MSKRKSTADGRTESSGGGIQWGRGHVRHGRIPDWVLFAPVSDRAVRLYVVLGRYCDDQGRAFPGKPELMERLGGIARSTLDAALAELVAINALAIEARTRQDGGRTSNDYVLHWTRAPEDRVGPSDGSEGGSSDGSEGLTRARSSPVEREKRRNDPARAAEDADESAPPPAPKLTMVDGRNLAMDVLAEVCQVAANSPRYREVVVALNGSRTTGPGIRESAWQEHLAARERYGGDPPKLILEEGETFERVLARAIRDRAAQYRDKMPGAALTPTALAKWWVDLPAMGGPRRRGGGLTAREVLAMGDE